MIRPTLCALSFLLVVSTAGASIQPQAVTTQAVRARIEKAMQNGQPLGQLYTSLGREYGAAAVKPLLELAMNEHNSDELRRTSLFGLGRIAGRESLGVVRKFMDHSSWMLRDAALKTAAALNARELLPAIEHRLSDKALIVRTTAVQTIGHLRLRESAPRLVNALFDRENYTGQKPLWIHKYILQVLRDFRYEPAVPKLVALLEKSRDQELKLQLVQTLEKITGKSFGKKPMDQQVYLWKRQAVAEKTF